MEYSIGLSIRHTGPVCRARPAPTVVASHLPAMISSPSLAIPGFIGPRSWLGPIANTCLGICKALELFTNLVSAAFDPNQISFKVLSPDLRDPPCLDERSGRFGAFPDLRLCIAPPALEFRWLLRQAIKETP